MDRKLETGHTRQGEPPGTGDRRKDPAGGGTSPHAEGRGDATTGGAGGSSEIVGVVPGPAGGRCHTGQTSPETPAREDGDEGCEVACLRLPVATRRQTGVTHRQAKERFVGPLARLLSGQGIGRTRRRAEMGRCAGEAQVIEASSRVQPSGSSPGAGGGLYLSGR